MVVEAVARIDTTLLDAFGASRPFTGARVPSSGTQEPSFSCLRVAAFVSSTVSVPSGFASVVAFGVRCPTTSTGLRESRAFSRASAISEPDPCFSAPGTGAGTGGFGGAAVAGSGDITTARPATTRATTPDRRPERAEGRPEPEPRSDTDVSQHYDRLNGRYRSGRTRGIHQNL